MSKFFNIAGPCIASEHYMIPAGRRCNQLASLVDQKQYFILHAPRQTGKTTLIRDFVRYLNEHTHYLAVYCSLERAQGIVSAAEGIPTIVDALNYAINYSPWLEYKDFARAGDARYTGAFQKGLADFCAALQKPLVIMFDEVDCLAEETLISFLRQLRQGYVEKDTIPFVHSLGLVGMRNIRDFKAEVRSGGTTLGSASPFNIVSKALSLRNFNEEELSDLYGQHTTETGQVFDQKVIEMSFKYTRGQPWLCNALAREMVMELLDGDYTRKITPDLVEQAVENIILRRDTHIDSLLERLKEERVRRVVEPIISGKKLDLEFDDDAQYVFDLGLLDFRKGDVAPANPIYGEVIMRTLSYHTQHHLPISMEGKYIKDGLVQMKPLLQDFQQFWRENSEIWMERYQYKEAAPHLILQAWLQRIVNGGGRITREYSAGRGRIDLVLTYGKHRYPVELKIRYSDKTREQGIVQLSGYLKSLGLTTGWLIIFDRDPNSDWDKKVTWEDIRLDNLQLHIVGC